MSLEPTYVLACTHCTSRYLFALADRALARLAWIRHAVVNHRSTYLPAVSEAEALAVMEMTDRLLAAGGYRLSGDDERGYWVSSALSNSSSESGCSDETPAGSS